MKPKISEHKPAKFKKLPVPKPPFSGECLKDGYTLEIFDEKKDPRSKVLRCIRCDVSFQVLVGE